MLRLYRSYADSQPFAVLPAVAPCLDDVVGSPSGRLSASTIYLTQFRRVFELLLAAGFAAAFPGDAELGAIIGSLHSSTAQWVGGFIPPLKLLPPDSGMGRGGSNGNSTAHLQAMDYMLQSRQRPVVLWLEAVALTSPVQCNSQMLPADMGLEGYAAAISRQPSDIRVVPVVCRVLLGGSSWVEVDVMQQLGRCWAVIQQQQPQPQQRQQHPKRMKMTE